VLIVEDIVDSGFTLKFLHNLLSVFCPISYPRLDATLRIVTMSLVVSFVFEFDSSFFLFFTCSLVHASLFFFLLNSGTLLNSLELS
jgi:hypothetical protein